MTNHNPQPDSLHVCEDFYSVQGEGPGAGRPAVFLRLAGCNLTCVGFSYTDKASNTHLGCDTKLLWKTGKKYDAPDLLERWTVTGYLEALKNGAHLIITGGEPTLQQSALIDFLTHLDNRLPHPPYIEMETNATITFKPELLSRVNQINASPKLKNNGDERSRRYKPEVLAQLAATETAIFKFVLEEPSDLEELKTEYLEKFQILRHRVWLMPEGGTMVELKQRSPWVIELCKNNYFNYSPRLQIFIWDDLPGV